MKKENRKLNLKKGIASIALATSLIFTGVPSVASAAVNPENIVKDEHYVEDRTAIRYDEMQTINEFFSIDVKVDTVEKAIILSDVINSYYPGPNMYSNTTCEEVLTIDIDAIYEEYLLAEENGTVELFAAKHLMDMAAIDAYTTLGCRVVNNEINRSIINTVGSLCYNSGFNHSRMEIFIGSENPFVLLKVENGYIKVNLDGEYVENLSRISNVLDRKYRNAVYDIGGFVTNQERAIDANRTFPDFNAFSYNGVDTATGKSAWLSAGDDDRKAMMTNAIEATKEIVNGENVELQFTTGSFYQLTDESRKVLEEQGAPDYVINNTIEIDLTVNKTKTLTK